MTTSTILSAAESLRSPDTAAAPDPRTTMFAGQSLPCLAAHHQEIEAIQLTDQVPEAVAIQFETARNLYLYAWHVYRFFPVAQSQALFTLEFGLRMRFPGRLPERYQNPKHRQPMLAGLLNYAIDQGLIRNEGFRRWHEVAAGRARERQSMEAIRIMIDQQLESMVIQEDESPRESWRLVGLSGCRHSDGFAELPIVVCVSYIGRDLAERSHESMVVRQGDAFECC